MDDGVRTDVLSEVIPVSDRPRAASAAKYCCIKKIFSFEPNVFLIYLINLRKCVLTYFMNLMKNVWIHFINLIKCQPTLASVSNVVSSSETDVTFMNSSMKRDRTSQRSK